MSSVYAIPRSGLQDAALRIETSAHNQANALTGGFLPLQVVSRAIPAGGVSSQVVPQANPGFDATIDATLLGLSQTNLAHEVVATKVAAASYQANIALMKTLAKLDQAVMDIRA